MPTYQEALSINEQYAMDNGKEASAIKILLMHFSALSSTKLLENMGASMEEEAYKRFLKAVDQYVVHNKPVQYITKDEHFYGYRFKVNENVMIPRCETEELVEHLLNLKEDYFNTQKIKLLDVGTGSGCLAISLSLEDDSIEAHATDISDKALEMARVNSESLHANVTFHTGHLLDPVKGQTFDIVISNPPYIPNAEYVEPLVKDHEPHLALFGGEDGLEYYRAILKNLPEYLNERYIVAFEHAYNKAKDIKRLCKKYLKDVRIIQMKDMQGKDRMTFALKKS